MIFMTSIMGAPWSSQCFWDFTLTKLHSGKDTGMGQAISVPLSPVTEFVIYSIEKLYFGCRQFWAIFIHPNEMFLGEFVTCVGRTSCFRRDNSCSIPMRWKASRGVENIVNFKEITCACLLWMVQFRSFLLQDHQDQYRNIQHCHAPFVADPGDPAPHGSSFVAGYVANMVPLPARPGGMCYDCYDFPTTGYTGYPVGILRPNRWARNRSNH